MKVCWVALIGRPNVGKSTLMNQIIKYDLSIVSPVAQTTRDQIYGIYTDDEYQIIFIDTPGFHKPISKFGEQLNKQAQAAVKESDLVLFLNPINQEISSGDQLIIEKLVDKANKIAIITKDDLAQNSALDLTQRYEKLKELGFKEIVNINYKNQTKIDDLLMKIKTYAYEEQQFFDDDFITDKSELFLTKELIRNSAIKFLSDELPHSIFIEITEYDIKPYKRSIKAIIYCKKESQKGIIIGKKGAMIKQIGTEARRQIIQKFQTNVYLELKVKVEKNWTNSINQIKKMSF